ncbi:MAG: hypothetical protein QXT82_09220, partial [Candidatus Caldarchaeum sp.]
AWPTSRIPTPLPDEGNRDTVFSHTSLKPSAWRPRVRGLEKDPGLHMDCAARPSPLIPYALTRLGACHRGVGRRNPSWSLPRSGATWPRPGKTPDGTMWFGKKGLG